MKKILFVLLVSLAGCWEPKLDTPEALLQHYIYLSFSGIDPKELEQYFTVDFLKKLQEEQKLSATTARQISYKNLRLKSYQLLSKLCETENVCQLRFQIAYDELNEKDQSIEFSTETKKIAVIKQTGSKDWKLDEIDHLKTEHEIKKQIDVPSN